MRYNVRDEKGRFVKKSSCKCGKPVGKCCKSKCEGSEKNTPKDIDLAIELGIDTEVARFITSSIKAAMDITMSTNKDIEAVANTELCWENIPEELQEDLRELDIRTVYDFGKYIVVARSVVNDAIEILGSQLLNIVKK